MLNGLEKPEIVQEGLVIWRVLIYASTLHIDDSCFLCLKGYTVDMTTDKGTKTKKFIVCSSCARAMRGRYKLEKVHYTVDFACNMGNGKYTRYANGAHLSVIWENTALIQ